MIEERRCGTCRHWAELWPGNDTLPAFGRCNYPLPISLRRAVQETGGDEGKSCPTWEKKQ